MISRHLLTIAAAAVRWAVRIALALLLLAALAWGVLHWAIVPRIDQFRPRLEQLATRWVGTPVTIGALSAQSNGLTPVIALTDVTVHDAQNRPGLTIAHAQVAFSIASLLRGGIEQLVLDHPLLEIRRTAQGQLRVGGLDLSGNASDSMRAQDWFFAQPEFAVREGTLRWIDDTRPAAPPVALSDLQLVIRNSRLHHQLRLDATPDSAWGAPFTLAGQFHPPLLTRHAGRWRDWSGQLYALLPRVDVSRLRQYIDLHADWGVDVAQGQGALRLWLDVRQDAITGVAADLALNAVSATLGPGLKPLALASLSGRISWSQQDRNEKIATHALRFTDSDGVTWPDGNFRLDFQRGASGAPESGTFEAEQLDLRALTKIASRLPLPPQIHQQLAQHPVAGLVETVQAHWSDARDKPRDWRVRARASGLSVGALALPSHADGSPALGVPGIEDAHLDIQATPAGGQFDLAIQDGALTFPGVFEQPRIPLQTLRAHAQWTANPETGQIAVVVPQAAFANADATGHLRAYWHTAAGQADARFPGVLDLDGLLTRADGARVWRYLPLHIPQEARDYVREAVRRGQAQNVTVRIKGDLRDVPFARDPKAGQFHFDAPVNGVTLAYVPQRLQTKGEPPWPALENLSGELIFDHASMQVKKARARAPAPNSGWQFTRIDVGIADLERPRVTVSADGSGALAAALAIVRGSPLARLLHGALNDTSATGDAALQLALDLPVGNLEQAAKVTGRVRLNGNDIRITPYAPTLAQTRGAVTFDQTGFALQDLRAQTLGGAVTISGGGQPGAAKAPPAAIHIAGTASSQGLRAMTGWGPVAALMRHASGQAAYQADLVFHGDRPALTVTSGLYGLALDLPEPLAKPANASWALRYADQPLDAARDTLQVTLASRLSVLIERDKAGQPLRGAYTLGAAAAAPLPAAGIAASVDMPRLDATAWSTAVTSMLMDAPDKRGANPAGTTRLGLASASATPLATASAAAAQDWLPTVWRLRTGELVAGGRSLHDVTASGTRQGNLWRAQVQARELAGQIQYQQAPGEQPGAVHARLSRLTIPVRAAGDNTQSVDSSPIDDTPQSIPALDIVADDFEIADKKLGKLTVDVTNRAVGQAADQPADSGATEWQLDKLSLEMPEATLTATGRWAGRLRRSAFAGKLRQNVPHRTELRFTLDVRDAGELLARLGTPGTIRRGTGQLTGGVAWLGAPYALDTPTLRGQLHLDINQGQFLKAEPGIAKLLGVLSLQALPRRLTLDFHDIFSAGFTFDFVRGDARITDGVVSTNNLQMKGAGAAVLIAGSASLVAETQELHVIVVPHIDAGTAALAATAINPAIGIGAFVAQWLLQKPLSKAATREFQISGGWANPQVTALERAAQNQPHAGDAPAAPPEPTRESDRKTD